MNREAWLQALTHNLRTLFMGAGYDLPEEIHVSVGFPSKSPLGRSRKRIGECWDASCSEDGANHIFISPLLGQDDAMHVLVHELVHAAVGIKCGHRGPFVKCAKAVGLTGKMTATVPTEGLKDRLAEACRTLGDYPHVKLEPPVKVKKGSRMKKMVCGCGRILRVSRKEAAAGAILCGLCQEPYALEDES